MVAEDMTANEAYWFVIDNPDCDIRKYQEIVCQDPKYSYYFARDVRRANIEYCQVHACKDPSDASWFMKFISEADIEYCYNFVVPSLKLDVQKFIRKDL